MKKLIIISIIFAVMLSAAVWEMVFCTRLFNYLEDGLNSVSISIDANKDNLNNPETLTRMDKVYKRWEKDKNLLFCISNHTVMRAVDEKLVSLKTMLEINFKDDAMVTVATTLHLVKNLKNDTLPVLTNIF